MKILLLDIETAPGVAYVWGLWDKFIPVDRLVEPGYTLCWSAKWHGKSKVLFSSIKEDGEEAMLEKIHGLLDEADVVVHYNGKKFDIPTLNKEFLRLGMLPPSPYKQVDLFSVVKKHFRFPSNKLTYVAKALGLGEKVKHKGFDLWKECMAGKSASWKLMKEYNKGDVTLLEDLYLELLPWISNHPNYGVYTDSRVCPNCGSTHLHSRGYTATAMGRYRRLVCLDCGKWSRERRAEKPEAELVVGIGG